MGTQLPGRRATSCRTRGSKKQMRVHFDLIIEKLLTIKRKSVIVMKLWMTVILLTTSPVMIVKDSE